MIQVTQVIEYLRSKITSMRIDGAAELSAAEDKSRLALPCLFVMLGNFTATTVSHSTFEQEYDERLILLAGLPAIDDRTGKYAQQLVYHVRNALFAALLNHPLDENKEPHTLHYVGDRMVEMDKARYWHQFEFKQIGRLMPEDGKQLELDYLNSVFVDWNLAEADENTHPNAQDVITPLYFTPED